LFEVVDVVVVVEFDIGVAGSPGLCAAFATVRPPAMTAPAKKLVATSLRIMMTLFPRRALAHPHLWYE
jgi:hypothetical protein